MIGTRLGPYEITTRLGEGGMGEVYRANDIRLKRDVAIKILSAAFTDDKEYRSPGPSKCKPTRAARGLRRLSYLDSSVNWNEPGPHDGEGN